MFVELTEEELAIEEWRDIPDVSGYKISNMGRVKSKDRIETYTTKYGKEVSIPIPGTLMSLRQSSKDGYLRVRIRNNSMRKELTVHRLVAKAFLPNPNNYS